MYLKKVTNNEFVYLNLKFNVMKILYLDYFKLFYKTINVYIYYLYAFKILES